VNISLSLPPQPGLVCRQPEQLAPALVEGARHIAYLIESGNADGLDGQPTALGVPWLALPRLMCGDVGQPHLGQLDRPGPQLPSAAAPT